jgi:endonuclease YncB( thermonuclease family)
MEAIRIQKVVEKDGEIFMSGLPFKKGQHVEMIFLIEPSNTPRQRYLPADRLRRSGLIGLWKDRKDIPDSAVYARQLREQAQNRRA